MDQSREPIGYRFGRFELRPHRRALLAQGAPVPLQARALDILILLVTHRDRVVPKQEIFDHVWQGMAVEDNNLTVQVSALRRALGTGNDGQGFISTIPGRGYQFVGEVAELLPQAPVPEPEPEPGLLATFPLPPPAPARKPGVTLMLAGLGLLAIAAAAGTWLMWPRAFTAPPMSLAVLPFRDLGPSHDQLYLADAITDDLTADLSDLPGSTVIARESAAAAVSGSPLSPRKIGRTLGVRYLIDGSLFSEREAGGGPGPLHLTAELIDTRNGTRLWSQTFDVVSGRVDDLREQIVQRLSSVLNFTLVQIEAARNLHDRPANPDAADLFLRARSALDQADSFAGLTAAQTLLERAVAKDGGFADALAELGLVLVQKVGQASDPDPRDYDRAVQVIAEALAIAPRNPLAIAARGELGWVDNECEQALPDFRLALSLDPVLTVARAGEALCDHDLGRLPDMIAELQEVIRIDPLTPRAGQYLHLIGNGYLSEGNLPAAHEWLYRARARIVDVSHAGDPLGWEDWNWLSIIALAEEEGRHADAVRELAAYNAVYPNRTTFQLSCYDSRALGRLPGRQAMMKALEAAGMPHFPAETYDAHVAPVSAFYAGTDFEPTPLAIPGGRRLVTPEIETLMAGKDPPRVIDVGHGAATIPGASAMVTLAPNENFGQALLQAAGGGPDAATIDRPVVVMGDGPYGWDSYNSALKLIADGFRNVLWYRGGEAAWVASGNKTEDRRLE